MEVDDVALFETQLADILARVAAGNEKNRISVESLCNWTRDYVHEHEQEIERFPKTVNDPHWGLFAYTTPGEDSVFVIVTFTADRFGVLAGRASTDRVMEFAENFDGDVPAVIDEVQKRFSNVSEYLTIPISSGYFWIEFGQ